MPRDYSLGSVVPRVHRSGIPGPGHRGNVAPVSTTPARLPPSLADQLADGPIVLDGGLATLLEAHGHDLSSDLWSARLLAENPAAITAAHREYFEAGAQVAITSSYQASFEGFEQLGLDRGQAAELLRRSVRLAREAAESAR